MSHKFSPRSMRILAHVHHECSRYGWRRPIAEVAEAIGEPMETVRTLVTKNGWASRFQPTPRLRRDAGCSLIRSMDEALERMGALG